MKLQIVSDLHIEFDNGDTIKLPKTDADVIILSGDIGVGFKQESKFVRNLAQEHGKPVIFVLGNHSFYNHGNIDRERGRWNKASFDDVYYLDEGKYCTINGVNFLGGIFWTDFNNYNTMDMFMAKEMMNDYRGVRMSKMDSSLNNIHFDGNEYLFTPQRSVDEHLKTKEWFEHILGEWKGQKNVVVTHHLPSYQSISPEFKGNSLNPAYASNLDEWIMDRDIALWTHGHVHSNHDYMIGDTRVICNPRGYRYHALNDGFKDNLVIEI